MLPSTLSRWTWSFSALSLLVIVPVARGGVDLPDKSTLEKVDFERHIMGLFGRSGCASGSCHGSFQGRGGFRLSLFGYDPEKDYNALTREMLGRRLNQFDVDQSQLLLKATGQNPHEGGQRFARDSWQYRVFKEWIKNGAQWERGSGQVKSVRIDPPEYDFSRPGDSGQLKVLATFSDDTEENITLFCDFRVNDDAVAGVSNLGQVNARQAGMTSIVVSYRGNVLPVRVLVPVEAKPGASYAKVEENNYIDREVFARLRHLNIVPSDLSGDLEFLRRVTIDTVGRLPTTQEARVFLEDPGADKRARKIDELLADPMHAALWATKFCDITGNNTDALENPQQSRAKRSQMWHDWFRRRIEKNMPYDEIVKGVLLATSRDGQSPEEWLKQVKEIDEAIEKGWQTSYADRQTLDLFWRRAQPVPVEQWGEKTAAAFLGVRLECAQCHKHPFDRWTQVDYRSFANVFTQVSVGVSPEAKKIVDEENAERNKVATDKKRQVSLVREVFVGAPAAGGGKGQQVGKALPHPETGKALAPKALGGPEIAVSRSADARAELYGWLRSPENPFFARSFVNRVWGHYFGVGIVDPVDSFSQANPPSNEQLLAALAQDFTEHAYDIRALERAVLNSRAYQLSSVTNETNRFDRNCYSHSYVRPMMAEVVVDVLNSALGSNESFGNDAPPGARAIEVGASRVNANLAYIFRIFGRPPRTSACDCERAMEPALPQKLFLMGDQNLLGKLDKGRLPKLLGDDMSDDQVLEELFLATLTRFPTPKDKELFEKYRAGKDRRTAFADALWALVNTREFILNH
jgi:hypothetical protein